jgi:drug/metabolite transporter (DMT)-like permease
MPVAAVLLTLTAAGVHALWNQLLAHTDDIHRRTAVGMLVGAVAFLPVALLDRRVEPVGWVLAGVSTGFELAYFALLATAYARAPLGVVYPVARGSAPVLVLLVSALFLGRPVSPPGVVGILLVVAGIGLVRGAGATVRLRDVGLALAVGACIAGYTLVDAAGVQHAAPAAYIEIVFAAVALLYTAAMVGVAGVRAVRAVADRRTAAAGLGIVAAYGLVLVALTLAPAPAVATVRETSVVIVLVTLAVTGKERVTRRQVAGGVAVCAGVACVVLG